MIPSLPRGRFERVAVAGYVTAFFVFLFLPLAVVAVFAFNDANYPAPPWRGFTLDWFIGDAARGRIGLFADRALLSSIWTSVVVAGWVTLLAVAAGTVNAFLLERATFRGKATLSLAMLAPLVIPGVILGISILAFASRLAQLADDFAGPRARISATGAAAGRCRTVLVHRVDRDADDRRAAEALRHGARGGCAQSRRDARGGAVDVTLPYLKPALIGAAAIAFLMSFENFNTTLMLVGSDPPLTIMMYGRMREGRDPGPQRGEPVPDGRLRAAGAGADAALRRRTRRSLTEGRPFASPPRVPR